MPLSTIGTNQIADGAVAVADIADGSVTTAKIADNAVTTAKVNPAQTDITSVGSLSGLTVSSGTVNMSSSLLQFSGNISLPNVGACIFRPSADTIAFGINNGQRISINQHGLLFGTDTASANALDDYEEGVFNPVFQTGGNSNGISHSISSGTYTKIGNRVVLNGFAAMNGKDGSNLTGGNVTIGGLPFAISNDNNSYSACGLRIQNISFADQCSLATIVGTSQLDFREITNSGSVTTLTDGNIASNSYVIFEIAYRTG